MSEPPPLAIVIKPQFLPRDSTDVGLAVAVGFFQTACLFGLPALLAFLLCYTLGGGLLLSLLLAPLAFCLAYGVFLLFVVWSLKVSDEGLHFNRVFGSPKFLSWDRISSVAATPRAELVLRGWLWPMFPSREMTPSLSALHHYRITWDKGCCYYPPACLEDFEQHVISRVGSQGV